MTVRNLQSMVVEMDKVSMGICERMFHDKLCVAVISDEFLSKNSGDYITTKIITSILAMKIQLVMS